MGRDHQSSRHTVTGWRTSKYARNLNNLPLGTAASTGSYSNEVSIPSYDVAPDDSIQTTIQRSRLMINVLRLSSSSSSSSSSASSSSSPPQSATPTDKDISTAAPSQRCPICLMGFEVNDDPNDSIQLPSCGHPDFYHRECAENMLRCTGRCGICNHMYVMTQGNQPPNGTMHVTTIPPGRLPLAGYEYEGTIVINYSFHSGIQDNSHPNPGVRYQGTSRTAYLPDTVEGRDVLQLLQRCFALRKTFPPP